MGDRGVLHSLLENFNDVQRKDICDVARGHLNENKLRRLQKEKTDTFWKSSKKEPIWLREKVEVKNHQIFTTQLPPLGKKTDGLKYSTNDVGIISPDRNNGSAKIAKKPDLIINQSKNFRRYGHGSSDQGMSSRLKYELAKNGGGSDVLRKPSVETFFPDTMVPSSCQEAPFSKDFIPSHIMFPTKNEQYKQYKKTGKQLLSMNDETNTNLKKELKKIEENMRVKLKLLESDEDVSTPNYFKLMVYSDAWDELCEIVGKDNEVKMFGKDTVDLKSIKSDHDDYVNALLEEQRKLSQQFPIDNFASSILYYYTHNVKNQEVNLRRMEDELLEELKENERLRKMLKNAPRDKVEALSQWEQEKSKEEEVNNDGDDSCLDVSGNTLNDLESQVVMLHAQIEEQYHEIQQIKKTQREEYVPQAVCQGLEQSIKEVEVDIQKLTKQNDFLEHDIQELENELEDVLVKTGIKQKDTRLLWRRVNSSCVYDM